MSELCQVNPCTMNQRGDRVTQNSSGAVQRNGSPCHVPRFRRPSVMGIEIVQPTKDAFVCETLHAEAPRISQKPTAHRTVSVRPTHSCLKISSRVAVNSTGLVFKLQERACCASVRTLDPHRCATIQDPPVQLCPEPYPCLELNENRKHMTHRSAEERPTFPDI